jgi:phage tail-like protein
MRFMSAFDAVLAPVLSVLGNQEYYTDPSFAPLDFLSWLASWVGIEELDETWPEESKRDLVKNATELFSIRGTAEGLKKHLYIYLGVEPVIEESGGCRYSETPNAELPGTDASIITIRIPSNTPRSIHKKKLDNIITVSKPAHMAHKVIFES